jgi:hypothetical protein
MHLRGDAADLQVLVDLPAHVGRDRQRGSVGVRGATIFPKLKETLRWLALVRQLERPDRLRHSRKMPNHHRIPLLAVLTSLALVSPCSALFPVDAGQLADDCRKKWPAAEYMYCTGLLTGIVETLKMGTVVKARSGGAATIAETADGSGPFCIAGAMTAEERAAAFVAYVEKHPERAKEAPRTVVADAMLVLDANPPPKLVSPLLWTVCGRKPLSNTR